MHKFIVSRCAVAVVVIGLLASCGHKGNDKQATDTASAPTSVTFLNIAPAISYAGVYAAQSQGFFADETLDVQDLYTDGNADFNGQDIVDLVVAGQADFGITSADRLLIARQAGQPVVAIMSVYQRDPTAILSLKTQGIKSPEDLIGKKLLSWNSDNVFRLFAHQVNLDVNQVNLESPNGMDVTQGIALFLRGQVDGAIVNAVEVEAALRALNIPYNVLYFYEYGIAMYPNVIFTTQTMVETHPDLVQHFVNGMERGTRYAVDNPDAMADRFLSNNADQLGAGRAASQHEVMRDLIPLVNPTGSDIGWMTSDTWQAVCNGMVANGLLQSDDIESAYTVQFVKNYYMQ